MDSGSVIWRAAVDLKICKGDELRFIPEAISPISKGTEATTKAVIEIMDGKWGSDLVQMMCSYYFAKAVEAVILWGQSDDGKFSIYYHPKHIINLDPEPEVPKAFRPLVMSSMKLGEQIFPELDEWIRTEADSNSGEVDLNSQLQVAFNWVSRVGMSYALENNYHTLGKGKKHKFWEFFTG